MNCWNSPVTINMKNMDAKSQLERFCYLGRLEPVYTRHAMGVNVNSFVPLLYTVIDEMEPLDFGLCIANLLKEGNLPRKDEAIFTLALYLAHDLNIEKKTNLREALPVLLASAEEFFMFCKYSRLLQATKNRSGFSRTTKKAITAWYAKRTPEELRAMWLKNRGLNGFTHRRLIRTCFIKDEVLGDNVLAGAFFKTCTELLKTPQLVTEPSILSISTLRTTDRKNEALKIIKSLRLGVDQVPPKLLSIVTVAEAVLPQMSPLEIINKWHVFCRHGHFEKPKFFKLLLEKTNREALQLANISPIIYMLRMDKIGIPVQSHELESISKKKCRSMRMEYFQKLFTDSFGLNRPAGLRTLITLTLQNNYKKKFLTKKKKVTYYQAAVGLAFTYFKREKHADVFSYTEDKVKLSPIPWDKKFRFDDAINVCDSFNYRKSSQRLVQPVMEALKRKEIYDLILIIVPSGGRSNPKQTSSFLCKFLDKYRETKNKNAKLVIVSLLRYKQSMTYSSERNENILEICGLDAHTTSLIDSFALNRFG